MKKLLLLAALALAGASLASPTATYAAELETGKFIRSSDGTIYWFAEDERRYVFPDGATLQSWLGGTPGMLEDAPDEALAPYPVGGPMTIHPGTRLVRFHTDPTVYVVTRGAKLRAVTDVYAAAYYGNDWMQKVDVLSIALYPNYRIGEPIVNVSDFDRVTEMGFVPTPEEDIRYKRENGLMPKSIVPFKAQVTVTTEPTVVHPPMEPTVVSMRVTITKPTTSIANLRTDIFRENGPLVHTCRGIDLCTLGIDYRVVTKSIEDRFYAIVSNEKMETLPRAYTTIITVMPAGTTP